MNNLSGAAQDTADPGPSFLDALLVRVGACYLTSGCFKGICTLAVFEVLEPCAGVHIAVGKSIGAVAVPHRVIELADVLRRVGVDKGASALSSIVGVAARVAGTGSFPDVRASAVPLAVLVLALVDVAIWKDVFALAVALPAFIALTGVRLKEARVLELSFNVFECSWNRM